VENAPLSYLPRWMTARKLSQLRTSDPQHVLWMKHVASAAGFNLALEAAYHLGITE
jgi:hypothetical protein